MKRMVLAASAALALMATGVSVAKDAAPDAKTTEQSDKRQTVCPITGEGINTNLFVDVLGKRIFVCCKGCISPIKKDPAKYISQMEKEGVTLDKAPVAAPAKSPAAK